MPAIFSEPEVQRIIAIAALACLVAIAYYIASKLRNAHKIKELTPEELLPVFSALRDEGKMSEEEFQAIKRHLGQLIQQGVRWGGENAQTEQVAQIMALAANGVNLPKKAFEPENNHETPPESTEPVDAAKETQGMNKPAETEMNTLKEEKN